ncbi:MAG: helix-turn-helix domain-containing protein [Gammaproteobacteria bacterium]|nr:helix-turn-helix domain-containing protein [Gammaproteobacteria bacterium]MDH5274816.1 helix-turn-helix domain-containing protein [Gammaproteobacteria bacterium]
MPVDWQQYIQFIFIVLALLLAGATLARPHTRWLGVLFLVVGLHGAVVRLDTFAGTVLREYSYAFALTYGPLFYLSLRHLVREEAAGVASIALALAAPAVGVLLIAAGVSAGEGFGLLLTLVLLAAAVAVYRELRGYAAAIDQARAAGTPPGLRWLWSALILYGALIAAQSLRALAAPALAPGLRVAVDLGVAAAFVVILAALAVRILGNPDWIPRMSAAERALATVPEPQPPTAAQQALHQALERCLREQRPFLDPDLSLKGLAAQLGWPPRQLSEVINRVDGCSFSHRINVLRVEEARRLLADRAGRERTLLDVALAAGFNSKSVFNLMFKRFAGCTPTEFREQAKKNAS